MKLIVQMVVSIDDNERDATKKNLKEEVKEQLKMTKIVLERKFKSVEANYMFYKTKEPSEC